MFPLILYSFVENVLYEFIIYYILDHVYIQREVNGIKSISNWSRVKPKIRYTQDNSMIIFGWTTKMKSPKPISWFRNTVYAYNPIKMLQSFNWKSNVTNKTYRLKLSRSLGLKAELRCLANRYLQHKYRTDCVPCHKNPILWIMDKKVLIS